jgi:hypothetical protein
MIGSSVLSGRFLYFLIVSNLMFDDVQYDVFTGKAIDVIGRPLSRKEVKRRVLAKNKRKGKQFEDDVKLSSEMQGWEVERKRFRKKKKGFIWKSC